MRRTDDYASRGRRLERLMAEFQAQIDSPEAGKSYSMSLALYPRRRRQ